MPAGRRLLPGTGTGSVAGRGSLVRVASTAEGSDGDGLGDGSGTDGGTGSGAAVDAAEGDDDPGALRSATECAALWVSARPLRPPKFTVGGNIVEGRSLWLASQGDN